MAESNPSPPSCYAIIHTASATEALSVATKLLISMTQLLCHYIAMALVNSSLAVFYITISLKTLLTLLTVSI